MRGWYRDSYRHSLAARGIRRYNYYAPESGFVNRKVSAEAIKGLKEAAALKYRAMSEGLSAEEAENRIIKVYPDSEDDLRTIWDAIEMSRVKADFEDLQNYSKTVMQKHQQEGQVSEAVPAQNIIIQSAPPMMQEPQIPVDMRPFEAEARRIRGIPDIELYMAEEAHQRALRDAKLREINDDLMMRKMRYG